MEAISTGAKTGIKLEEYQGTFSLSAQKESNGEYYVQWAKFKTGKDTYADKDWPVKVTLGDRATAIGVLQMLLKELGE